jgi:glycosyltransferase involved in cell wall biosynthesis
MVKFTKARIKKAFRYIAAGKFAELYHQLISARILDNLMDAYDLQRHVTDEVDLEKQRHIVFKNSPLISIIVPVYNPSSIFLQSLLQSVLDQTYSNWEICLANAGNSQEVKKILCEYEKKDKRIKVQNLDTNGGISVNSNAAIKMASGDFFALLDHDDILTPDALFEMVKKINTFIDVDFIYSDEDKIDAKGEKYFGPYFKPDWSPYFFLSNNYLCHFSCFRRSLFEKLNDGFLSEFDGAQDYDLFLRLIEHARRVEHIPKILYHWRVHQGSTAQNISAKSYAVAAGAKALNSFVSRNHILGAVKSIDNQAIYQFKFTLIGKPKVSILIPNYNAKDILETCVKSILDKSTYDNYEILIIENNSTDENLFAYYTSLKQYPNIKILNYESDHPFNYSKLNNWGRSFATGEYLVLLNNDTEIISPDWLEKLLEYAQREDVGCVGCKLLYRDETIQHVGVVIGLGGAAGHVYKGLPKNYIGYASNLRVTRHVSAVTGACFMVKSVLYDDVHGLDENLAVAFNDIDFCLKMLERGKCNLVVPYVNLYHYESKTRGAYDNFKKSTTLGSENEYFIKKWKKFLQDPYYNINFNLELPGYKIR